MKLILTTFLLINLLTGCRDASEEPQQTADNAEITTVDTTADREQDTAQTKEMEKTPIQEGMERAYFASGCFWCVEAVFESVRGVEEAISGYSGGHTKNPTYKQSNTGKTGHAEAVEVIYDPTVTDFETLVTVYFGSMDPTQKNGQGPDIGSQYRSIAFYQDEEEKKIIEEKIQEISKEYDKEIAVEVLPFEKFWKAEKYHQNYKKNHPEDDYIKNVSNPRLNRFKRKFPYLLKENKP